MRTLADLTPGETGTLARFLAPESSCLRLMELGLIPGTPVRHIRSAPMGDPMELEVRGYSLSLRRADAAQIALEA